MNPYRTGSRGSVYHARAEEVYPLLEPASFRLAFVDGPYNLRIAEWDKFPSWDAFRAWYRPHLEAIGALLMPSAWLILCGTEESTGELRPLIRSQGWEYTSPVFWWKTNPYAQKGVADCRSWPDATETFSIWRRECVGDRGPGYEAAEAAGASDRNEIRKWLYSERQRAGLKGDALEEAVNKCGGKGNMICRHSFTGSQWWLPTWDQWRALHRAWNLYGDPAGRPYLQRDRSRVYDLGDAADPRHREEYDGLKAEYEVLKAEYETIKAEYEALRAPFTFPRTAGVLNVWHDPAVGPESRTRTRKGETHPCEKRLDHVSRLIRAHTLPGEAILEPFGGTCRVAVACEKLPEAEARRYACIEPEARWIDAIDLTPNLQTELFPLAAPAAGGYTPVGVQDAPRAEGESETENETEEEEGSMRKCDATGERTPEDVAIQGILDALTEIGQHGEDPDFAASVLETAACSTDLPYPVATGLRVAASCVGDASAKMEKEQADLVERIETFCEGIAGAWDDLPAKTRTEILPLARALAPDDDSLEDLSEEGGPELVDSALIAFLGYDSDDLDGYTQANMIEAYRTWIVDGCPSEDAWGDEDQLPRLVATRIDEILRTSGPAVGYLDTDRGCVFTTCEDDSWHPVTFEEVDAIVSERNRLRLHVRELEVKLESSMQTLRECSLAVQKQPPGPMVDRLRTKLKDVLDLFPLFTEGADDEEYSQVAAVLAPLLVTVRLLPPGNVLRDATHRPAFWAEALRTPKEKE